jgi:hypothetical protein
MKNRPVGAELFHADRRTDGRTEGRKSMTQLKVAVAILRTRLKQYVTSTKTVTSTNLLLNSFNPDGMINT